MILIELRMKEFSEQSFTLLTVQDLIFQTKADTIRKGAQSITPGFTWYEG